MPPISVTLYLCVEKPENNRTAEAEFFVKKIRVETSLTKSVSAHIPFL